MQTHRHSNIRDQARHQSRHKCYARHAKHKQMLPSATLTTQSKGGCEQVLCLPRKVPRCPGRLTATKRYQTQVDAPKCQRCCTKLCDKVVCKGGCVTKCMGKMVCVCVCGYVCVCGCDNIVCVTDCVCDRVVYDKVVGDKAVRERCCV